MVLPLDPSPRTRRRIWHGEGCTSSSCGAARCGVLRDHPPSGFHRALAELQEWHEHEVREAQSGLEAKLALMASELEELRTIQVKPVEARLEQPPAVVTDAGRHRGPQEERHVHEPREAQSSLEANTQALEMDDLRAVGQKTAATSEPGLAAPAAERRRDAPEVATRHTGHTSVLSAGPPTPPSSERSVPGHFVAASTTNALTFEELWRPRGARTRMASRHEDLRFNWPWAHAVTNSNAFDPFCSGMIIGNTVLMGVSTNWSVEHYWEEELPVALTVLDHIFTTWFALELLLRIAGSGCSFLRSRDWGWNFFDFAVVSADITTNLVQVAAAGTREAGGSGLSTVRLLRVLRVTRALRLVRILRFFRELRMMVLSVLRSGTSLVWSIVLFYMDVFLFAVYLTQNVTVHLHDHGEESEVKEDLIELFGTMSSAVYTLFMAVSGGISWVEVSRPLMKVHWSNSVVLVFFVFFTVYALTNIITGIFVDTAIQSAHNDREEVIQTQLLQWETTMQEMKELFSEADGDADGAITFEELMRHLRDERVRAHLAAMGLQLQEAGNLFRLLDMDKSGSLSIDEFLMGCMRLKGNARSIDLATLMYESKKMFSTLKSFYSFVEQEFRKVNRHQVDGIRMLLSNRVSSEPSSRQPGSDALGLVEAAGCDGLALPVPEVRGRGLVDGEEGSSGRWDGDSPSDSNAEGDGGAGGDDVSTPSVSPPHPPPSRHVRVHV